jgi:phage terminase large subunit-like protein
MLELPAVWSRQAARWESPDGRYHFDADAGDWAEGFFPAMLVHHIGEYNGQPFDLLDYQRILIRAAFGWKRQDGLRRFRKIFLAVPKGNGKSPLCSGVGLLLAGFDNEAGAEVYAAAADKQQARIVFDTARIMVSKSEKLDQAFEAFRDSLKVRGGTEYFQVVSADAPTKHGFRPHGIVFDEFHAQPDRHLYDSLDRGTVKRRQPMTWLVTTAGDDDESICFEEWDYARRVMSGSIEDETYLAMIFELRPEDDWTDIEVIKRVNPGYGITVKADALANSLLAAQNEPRKRNSFLQLHGNRWSNQATAWIPVEWWDACDSPVPPDVELAAFPCAIGIDMAQKIDLAAAPIVFRLPLEGAAAETVEVVTEDEAGAPVKKSLSLNYRIVIIPAFWLPEDTLRERAQVDHVRYDIWRDEGLLNATGGAVIDSDAIVSHVLALPKRFPLAKQAEVAYDPAFATEVAMRLQAAGYKTVEVLQNYRNLSEACQVFEALVKARRVIHGGHRLLRWNVENVAVRQDDAGRIRPVKPRKQAKRIDGVVATLMALSRLMALPEPAPAQDYSEEVWSG